MPVSYSVDANINTSRKAQLKSAFSDLVRRYNARGSFGYYDTICEECIVPLIMALRTEAHFDNAESLMTRDANLSAALETVLANSVPEDKLRRSIAVRIMADSFCY